mgnify:CR=1 FL=1
MAGVFKPYSISFTDIDNDRDLDMIVSTNEENKIRILRGTGQGLSLIHISEPTRPY